MKMKLADCASLCNVDINTLSRIENGNPNSALGATFSIPKGLGISMAYSLSEFLRERQVAY
jgi:transcriptional regulator with XRE-family HTH domain